MADNLAGVDTQQPEISSGKPLQTIPYAEKNKEWRKQNVAYFIRTASVNLQGQGFAQQGNATYDEVGTVADWYDWYNNRIDSKLFDYVTNPLNATKQQFKAFPARIRNLNILRPTIDLLIGEYSRRPFKFDVINLDGDGAYNSFLEEREKAFKKNLTTRIAEEVKRQQGDPSAQNMPDPATFIDAFNGSYKDNLAVTGYKALRQIIAELKLREKFKQQFKHWCIAGSVASIKGIAHGDIYFENVSPKWTSVNKAPATFNYEDGSDLVFKFRMTVADLIDMFYEDLKEENIAKLEANEDTYRRGLFQFFTTKGNQDESLAKCDLYYTTWISRKKIGFLTYSDPLTGEPQKMEVDELYVPDTAAGESVEWTWVNEAWEGWRINDDIYLGIRPCDVQRNEMGNLSACKLPGNGRRFSDLESKNVSVFMLGMPYQIMYMILNYRIELLIAKSKGKILLLDKNTISDDEEHGDEKVFYYAEALGYMLLDRSQDGVDRMWNQYGVQDMSLFNGISELIKLAQYYKGEWEEMMGFTRQRKGDINSSDGLGTTNEAIFRSSVITDILFSTFDDYVNSELQGLHDLSKVAWANGKRGHYVRDDGQTELLNIDPEVYCNSNLGIFPQIQSELAPKLEMMKNQVNAIAQRKDVKLSTIADIIFTDSYAEMKEKLKKAEAIEQAIAAQNAESEHERNVELEQIKRDYEQFQHQLELEKIDKEWDRRDNNEYIKAEVAPKPEGTDSVLDTGKIEENAQRRLETLSKFSLEREKLQLEREANATYERVEKMKDKTKNRDISSKSKTRR